MDLSWIFKGFADLIANILNSIFSFLPDSPFRGFISNLKLPDEFLGYLNWLIPVRAIVTISEAWILCILSYYVYSQLLRLIKAIK